MPKTITMQDVFSLLPERKRNGTKHDYGRLLVIAGSSYYRGAAYLACAGALRTGVGICSLCSIEKVITGVSTRLPECTFLPANENENGTISADSLENFGEISGRFTSILIGCGLAIDENTRELVKNVVQNSEAQLIIDADGLNIISEAPDVLSSAKLPPVITPHFNEMARLCHTTRQKVEERPEQYAFAFAKKFNCTVVLKSHITYVASPDGRIEVNTETGNSGLSKGGSGDLLAGMISSFCAQGMSAFDAAKAGVYLHGKAADLCSERLSKRSMLPSDVLDDVSTLFAD